MLREQEHRLTKVETIVTTVDGRLDELERQTILINERIAVIPSMNGKLDVLLIRRGEFRGGDAPHNV